MPHVNTVGMIAYGSQLCYNIFNVCSDPTLFILIVNMFVCVCPRKNFLFQKVAYNMLLTLKKEEKNSKNKAINTTKLAKGIRLIQNMPFMKTYLFIWLS